MAANRFKNIIKEKKQSEKMLVPKANNMAEEKEEIKDAWMEEKKDFF